MDTNQTYLEFVKAKMVTASDAGFEVQDDEINPLLKPHQKQIVKWAVRGGCRGIFAAFGLGKTFMQLEIVRLVMKHSGGMGLIVAPLGVRGEFRRDAEKLGITVQFIRTTSEACDPSVLYLTNYESIREGKLDPRVFTVASLDEASILRGMGGTKTFREFMTVMAGDDRAADGPPVGGIPYRYVATATPSPNDFLELLAYAAYLGILDVSQAKTRFFKRDSTKADVLTLHPHKEREFWLWVASWAAVITKPSDLGAEFSDEGYDLPGLTVRYHVLSAADIQLRDRERDGQMKLIRDAATSLPDAAAEKRGSLPARVAKVAEILASEPENHFLIWHHLEDERKAIEAAVPEVTSVWGKQDLDERENRIALFSEGKIKYLSTKPVLAGSGCNFQYHCHRAIFCGVDYKFNDFIQALHRILRFLQGHHVVIDIIHTEAEAQIVQRFLEKWEKHKLMTEKIVGIVKEYGLGDTGMKTELKRELGVTRHETTGQRFRCIHNDCVQELQTWADNLVHLILTSIPFSTQYEYSPNYNDFGHTDNNAHFWRQMDFLVPHLYRVLQPGRMALIHVKDRITPGGINGLGFQTVYPLHCDTIQHFQAHGFAYLGMKTIVTDVVRENNQTYRLGYTEQCKDASRMGVGMPEYLLYFRKPPSDNSNGYADLPVVKAKDDYSLGRWQIDAHGFMRSSGNRLLTPADLEGLTHPQMFQAFKKWSLGEVYDYANHVGMNDWLKERGALPVDFMLLQPQSWAEDVWTDITRMRTLNAEQYRRGQQMHLCPIQLDIADRAIEQLTMPGEIVYDPFGGIMSVPRQAVLLGRQGWATELNPAYYDDGRKYCQAAEYKFNTPTLFDALLEDEEGTE